MEITWNNLTYSRDLICFSGVPNILKFDNTDTQTGAVTKARYTFTITSGGISQYDSSKDYTITIGDYSIKGTADISKVGGTVYLLPTTTDTVTQRYCAMTIVNALRNVPWISANFDVYLESNLSDGSLSNVVQVVAKKESVVYNVPYSCNWGSGYSFNEVTAGMNSDTMLQGNKGNNFVVVDVYRYNQSAIDFRIGGTPLNNQFTYVTTLQKTYFGEPVSFNLTPVLSSFLDEQEEDYNTMSLFKCIVYGFSNGKNVFSQATDYMWFTNGYLCNLSDNYINFTNPYRMAANNKRGGYHDTWNHTLMYTYYPQLDFSLFVRNSFAIQPRFVIRYLDSAKNEFNTQIVQPQFASNKSLQDFSVMLNQSDFDKATYIDLELYPLTDKYRYNVIKPIKAADDDSVTRVFWYNEYGGISFMDFTGERTETRKEDIEYYERQSFDYYESQDREMTKVYSKKIPVEVKHSTHYIEKDGTYLLYSLQSSKKAWIYQGGGTKYYIHVTNLEVKESSNASHIYQGTITYEYSMNELF